MREVKIVFMKDDTCISNKFIKVRSESLNTTEIHLKTIAFLLCTSIGSEMRRHYKIVPIMLNIRLIGLVRI